MAVFELYSRISSRVQSDTPQELVQRVLDEMVRELGYKRGFIMLANARSNSLEGAFGVNMPRVLLESLSVPMNDPSPLAQALRLGKVIHVDDASQDIDPPGFTRELSSTISMPSFVSVPLSPMSGVLVLGKDGAVSGEDLRETLPYVGRLVVALWEAVHESPSYEMELQSSVERDWLWHMVNSVPHPLVLCDEQNSIVMENIHAEGLFKASPDDSEGKRHAVELNSFLFSAALSSFSLDQGPAPGRELTLVDPIEGSELLYEMICRPAASPRTGERGVVAFLENVTDLRRAITELQRSLASLQHANEELRHERDRLNLILENVENPIIVATESSDIILMNSSAERLLQPPDDTHSGKATVYSANDARLTSFLAQLQLETGDVRRGELQLVDPATNEMLTMSVTGTKARNHLGEVVAIVCVLQDLTRIRELERRRVEHQLFESEKLAAVGRLAAAVAHEVNNPLEAIKNCLHLVMPGVPASDPNRKFLDIASRETERVSTIIRQMLSFYRQGTQKAPVDVNAVLEEVIALLQAQFKGSITWRISLGRQVPKVIASADKLKQVFLNLLLNAREAMEDSGELSVVTRTSRVSDAEFSPGKYVLVEISDTGMGISEENLSQIFDPFFSTKRERHGTGMGLWVSQDIVHQYGGQIKVRSQPGRGSTFTVALPIGGQND